MLNQEHIFEMISKQECPFWWLQMAQGYGTFNPLADHDADPNGDMDKEIERSINRLKDTIEKLSTGDTKFRIVFAKSKASNQGGRKGPFDFIYTANPGAGNNNGMAGAPAQMQVAHGMINERELDRIMSLERERTIVAQEKARLEYEREKIKDERERWDREKAEKERELKEKEAGLDDNSEKAKRMLGKTLSGLFDELVGRAEGTGQPAALAGVEQEEPTEQELLVESIAANIFEHVPDVAGIKAIGIVVQQEINKRKKAVTE